jgi:hypothetical protein
MSSEILSIEVQTFTTITSVALEVQPLLSVYSYVITVFAVPAAAGLNEPPVTPVPENVPPAGAPPAKLIAPAFLQMYQGFQQG